jgi:hypothetical protein
MDLQFRGAYSEGGAYMPVYTVALEQLHQSNLRVNDEVFS